MNVYDFDETIFYPYSMLAFAGFCFRRHPKMLLTAGPKFLKILLKYVFDHSYQIQVAAVLNSTIKYLDNPQKDIEEFWRKYENNFSDWYLKQRKKDDLIITGSPSYLIEPIAKKMGFKLIASEVDPETGVMIGNVRMAKEKAKYIIDLDMPIIENFYSDSISDTPIALLAEHAYLVKNKATKVEPWPHLTKEFYQEVHKSIDKKHHDS